MMSVILTVIKTRNGALPGGNSLVITPVMMNQSANVMWFCCFLCYDLSCNDLMLLMMQDLLTVDLVMCF